MPPADHPAFYAASRYTLNVTRADMIAAGWSPSVRLFEAGACGVPIISDIWQGLSDLLQPGREIILAPNGQTVIDALERGDEDATAMGAAARTRILDGHTAAHRAEELERHLEEAARAKSERSLALAC